MRRVLLATGAAMFALGAQSVPAEDLGLNNQQHVSKPPGDPSIVEQYAAPGSRDNLQSATAASPGDVPNTVIQSTAGSGNVQNSVQIGGSGNVAVQTQHGSGNRQSVTQTGDGNRAIQSQSGDNHSGTLDQHGGETDIQIQK